MADFDYHKQAQRYYSQFPAIILGSGASAAFGLSGMGSLSKYLLEHVDISGCDPAALDKWSEFSEALGRGVDLETALHDVRLPPELTSQVVLHTWGLLNPQDIQVYQGSIQQPDFFALSRLIKGMFRSANSEIDIITTNYDRLAEYAIEQAGYHHYTGFSHGYSRVQANKAYLTCERIVNVLKVHGSLDWFQSPMGDVVAFGQQASVPTDFYPQIVTPGIEKYSRTYHEPFRTIIHLADDAIRRASSYLCIGFGFNDEHIQEKLVEKCVREDASITLVTRDLSEAARGFLVDGNVSNYLAIERGETDKQSIIYSSENVEPIMVDGDYWSFNGYLSLII